eukprot:TRINITY_DN1423_c0_g3_i1.p1 TRINITY_DN1423_c0_g3~~TRINITY_DN1423_c0_g3_i1.p1  ORF type:complete len:778 (-),score=168.09 TRINITY_DN1423_c0_g3_i1:25-2358(-)
MSSSATKTFQSLGTPVLVSGKDRIENIDNIINFFHNMFYLNPKWTLQQGTGMRKQFDQIRETILHPISSIASAIVWRPNEDSTQTQTREADGLRASLLDINKRLSSSQFLVEDLEDVSIADLCLSIALTFVEIIPTLQLSDYPNLVRFMSSVKKKTGSWEETHLDFNGFVRYLKVRKESTEAKGVTHLFHTVDFPFNVNIIYQLLLDPFQTVEQIEALLPSFDDPLAIEEDQSKSEKKSGFSLFKKKPKDADKQSPKSSTLSKTPNNLSNSMTLQVPDPNQSNQRPSSARQSVRGASASPAELEKTTPRAPDSNKTSKVNGGQFQIKERGGSNLLLVTDSLIVQQSKWNFWPTAEKESTIFIELEYVDRRTRVNLHELSVPVTHVPQTDLAWSQFWPEIGGVRTAELRHSVFFNDIKPSELFDMWTTPKKFSKFTKMKCKADSTSSFTIAKNLTWQAVTIKVINSEKPTSSSMQVDSSNNSYRAVLGWRYGDWSETHSSTLEITIKPHKRASLMHLVHRAVPFDKVYLTNKWHRQAVWKKFPNHLSRITVTNSFVLRDLPKTVYDLFVNFESLTKRLGSPCYGNGEKASEYMWYDGWVSGVIVSLHPCSKIVQTFILKEWAGHKDKKKKSTVTFEFSEISDNSTLIHIVHRDVPLHAEDMMNDFWRQFFVTLKGVGAHEGKIPCDLPRGKIHEQLADLDLLNKTTNGRVSNVNKTENLVRFTWQSSKRGDAPPSSVSFEIDDENKTVKYCQQPIPIPYLDATKTDWEPYLIQFLKRK